MAPDEKANSGRRATGSRASAHPAAPLSLPGGAWRALLGTARRCAPYLTTNARCFKRQAIKLSETLYWSQSRTASTRFFGRLLRSCTRL